MIRSVKVAISKSGSKVLSERRNWILVTGFPGFGYVGTIAVRYMVKKLGAVKVGTVFTRYMPDFTAIDDYGVVTPFEIFAHSEKNVLFLLNNVIPHTPERQSFVEAIADWFTSVGGSRAILIGGLNSKFRVGGEELSWVCINNCGWELAEPPLPKGLYIVGPLALLTMAFEIRGVPTLVILPYTDPSKYDPKAASVAVKKVGSLLNVSIDVRELIEHSKVVEEAEEMLKEAVKEAESKVKMYM
ncbi:MAG: PAC2 family protein [Sulfolobales archaeon]|nr:PAC2 family protein [Sulfolobales archaeon]MCX8209104.1 PAC2 family protein [Sulfolobales archaeon]MDW8010254.1 PAC2 family protein [Sulfolobales archaeon]